MHDRRRRLNAIKHGAFSPVAILPGENAEEFATIVVDLIEEWDPDGLTEEDAVLAVAKAIWRKRRVQKFLIGRVKTCTFVADDQAYERAQELRSFCDLLDREPEVLESHNLEFIPRDLRDSLKDKFSAKKFKSTSERVRAIQEEIKLVLLPAREEKKPPYISYVEAQLLVTPEVFDREVVLDERLDAAIDRAIKRLMQIKAAKQILGGRSTANPANTSA